MKKPIILCSILLFAFFILQVSKAQVINVPGENELTIQQGIELADPGDTVLVADGIYLENINFMGKAITVASHFLLDADTNHINNTIINASEPTNPDYGSAVMFNTGEDSSSVICGFTITGGTGMYDTNYIARIGGGIVCYHSTAKIMHNIITGNSVSSSNYAWGGGIICIRETGNEWIIIEHNTISNNQASILTGPSTSNTATGGGMEIWGNARIRNNIIKDNHAICNSGFSAGGGIVMTSVNNSIDTLSLENNAVIDNSVTSINWWCAGGGLQIEFAYGIITSNIFENNSSNGNETGHGGGIKVYHADAIISSNTVSNNQAFGNTGAYGGGISIWYSNTYLTGNDINHNQATSANEAVGGGIHYYYPGIVKLFNNTLTYNKLHTEDTWGGGGVVCYFAQDKCTFLNNQFTGNAGPIYSTYPQLISFGSGGGMMIFDSGDHEAVVDGNIFHADTAKFGGGLSIKHSFNLKIFNNLFSDSYAYLGGGMDIVNTGMQGNTTLSPIFSNNTFYNNSTLSTGYGGSMFIRCEINSPPVLINNIFQENQSPYGKDIFLNNNTDTILIAYSNIDPANIMGSNSTWVELENINADPVFCDSLFHLDPTSPCLDTGSDSVHYQGNWYHAPDHDFEGSFRPFGEGVDIGADEWDGDGNWESSVVSRQSSVAVYPNPTSGIVDFRVSSFEYQRISLKIYDAHGREVATVMEGRCSGGQVVRWNASNLLAGVYFYRLAVSGRRSAVSGKILVNH